MLDASLLGGLAGNLGGGAGAGDLSSVIECTVGTSGQLRGLCVPAMLVPIVCEPLGFKAAAQNRTCDDQSVCCYADVEESTTKCNFSAVKWNSKLSLFNDSKRKWRYADNDYDYAIARRRAQGQR